MKSPDRLGSQAVCLLLVAGAFAALASSKLAAAEGPPRLLKPGETPNDRRLGPLKSLDGYFPFTPPKSAEEWATRRERVQRQILVATGLWPLPAANSAKTTTSKTTPHDAVIHGRVERPGHAGYPGYTVERVSLESYPGHFVTGSLFRPLRQAAQSSAGQPTRSPAVLCPHGHIADGRFSDSGLKAVREQIAVGAERFEVGGRHTEQARCVQLARMGCVVFNYDMLGYADSGQISYELAHKFAKQRPEFDGFNGNSKTAGDCPDFAQSSEQNGTVPFSPAERWGFFSAQAEMRAQSIFGLQTFNSLSALDWISSLPDVDPERIGVTGGSGGGTQSMILSAIDPRISAAFPAVMVSTAMQGGCTCENASLLRVDTGNIEFAALCAPRPLGMSAANDWTKDIDTKGLPELKQLYELLGAKDRVMAKALVQFPHNYNYVSREVMYQHFNKYLTLGLESPVLEEDYQPLDKSELTVWDAEHPRPPGGPDYERSLLAAITQNAERSLAELTPRDAASLASFRETVGGAVDVIVGRRVPAAEAIQWDMRGEEDRHDWMQFSGWLRDPEHGEELPVVFLHPYAWNRRVAIWLRPQGKAGLFLPSGAPRPEIARLLKAGTTVVGVDLLYQGELVSDAGPLSEARKVENPREFAGFTLGYNAALPAQRAHDVLTVISFCRNYQADKPEQIILVATDGAAPWAAAALAQAGSAVDRAAIDTIGFRFASLRSIRDVNLLPAIVKYGDLPGLLALVSPRPLWLAGETTAPPLVKAAFAAAESADQLQLHSGSAEGKLDALVDWVLR